MRYVDIIYPNGTVSDGVVDEMPMLGDTFREDYIVDRIENPSSTDEDNPPRIYLASNDPLAT